MLESNEIEKRIDSFKFDLSSMPLLKVIRKHIINGNCAIISNDQYFDLRAEVAEEYQIHPNDVLVVGSAKLGFSIAPHKRYRHFTETSDIDLVIVSSTLFDRMWKDVHRYSEQGGYWERSQEFKSYLFQGWIRPDKLPPAKSFELANDWWSFFNSLSGGGKFSLYKIAGALYKDWQFLESYQLRSVSACAEQAQN